MLSSLTQLFRRTFALSSSCQLSAANSVCPQLPAVVNPRSWRQIGECHSGDTTNRKRHLEKRRVATRNPPTNLPWGQNFRVNRPGVERAFRRCLPGAEPVCFGMMSLTPLMQIELPGIHRVKSGKVREIFDLGEAFLIVATDRISAFDVVMPNGIPRKGEVLTRLSFFWFRHFADIAPHHLLAWEDDPLPKALEPYAEQLRGRSMLVKKANPLPIECVVRGYLAGSAWKEYQQTGSVCGIQLPEGLVEAAELPKPIFTPATKAVAGHDENIPFEQAERLAGKEVARKVRELSLRLYTEGREHARKRGIIIADAKFEFGLVDCDLTLIDEALTPDSSRFWPADQYQPGRSQPSFDKQFVRDYLESVGWNKQPPAPELPEEIVRQTMEKYLEAYRRLTGREL